MKNKIDTAITKTIILLNERGYKTIASCSGHNKPLFYVGYIAFEKSSDCHKVFQLIKNSRMKNRLEIVRLIPKHPEITFDTKGLTTKQIRKFWNEVYLKLKNEN